MTSFPKHCPLVSSVQGTTEIALQRSVQRFTVLTPTKRLCWCLFMSVSWQDYSQTADGFHGDLVGGQGRGQETIMVHVQVEERIQKFENIIL